MPRKPEELKPEIVAIGNPEARRKPVMDEEFTEDDYRTESSETDSSNSFFRKVIDALFSRKNVGSKTEYISLRETFLGAKLEFMGSYGSMPYTAGFLHHLENKRISYKRKGRIEVVRTMERREEEYQDERNRKMLGSGVGGMLR